MGKRVSGSAKSGVWGEVELTQGNIDNNHFYLRGFLDRFPAEIIGGSNKSKAAAHSAIVDWGGGETVETDIDGEDKMFFRKRGWVGRFFALNAASPGDMVRVEETAPYRYSVSLRKKGRA